MQNIQERILKNLNEFTDDAILSDGTIGPIPGSDADCTFDEDEIAEYGKMIGLGIVEVHRGTQH